MSVLALDIGQSTGFVIANLSRRRVPVLLYSETIDLRDRDPEEHLTRALGLVFGYDVKTIVSEYPIGSPVSASAGVTREIAKLWERWIFSLDFLYEEIRVRPAEWKPTPSAKIDIYQKQTNSIWESYTPTRHEKDAAAILHWVSNFSRYSDRWT